MPEDLHREVCAEVLAALQHHSNVNDHWCLSWSMKSVGGRGWGGGWGGGGVRRSGSGSSSRCSSSGRVSGRGNSSRDVVVGGGGSGKQ